MMENLKDTIVVDFNKTCGKIKPMHSVNNAPVYKFASDQRITNITSWREAGIPYGRTHDASFYSTYGGEHTVDVNMIFTDWSRDADDPDAYDFVLTDEYLDMMEAGGTKAFYRLGSKIEHWQKKYNTLPPKNFQKWAEVCEHIIRHCNEGWANGKHRNIEYWEIWNEPDLDPDDSTHKRCWGGTRLEFYELFNVTFKHLKSCFPNLKIGGPAVASLKEEWVGEFFKNLQANDLRPDFFSWHVYSPTVEKPRRLIRAVRSWMNEYGLENAESILNEWNYVKGWHDDAWIESLRTEKNLKGSAFIASVMLMSQQEPLDMLMYYDARPGGMNGLYCTDRIYECLKGYYPFYMFNRLFRDGTAVEAVQESEDVWAAASVGESRHVMLSYYNDDDNAPEKTVKVTYKNVDSEKGVRLSYYCLDADHDCDLVREEIFTAKEFSSYIKMPLHSTWLLEITAL